MKKPRSAKVSAGRAAAAREDVAGQGYPTVKDFIERRALFLIIVSSVLVYANSLGGEFVFDDVKQIVGNADLRSWGNVFHAFTSDVWSFQRATFTTDIPPPYYRPLFTVYMTVGYHLFGLWEPGWHLMNLAVHTGATIAVYQLLRRLSNDAIVAALAALIFAVHPAHVESVSWISGIPDPLAALFYVPAMIWYVRYREEGRPLWLIASAVAYALSTLCKETALVLPAVIFVWEMTRERERGWLARLRRAAPLLVPYIVVAVGYLALRFAVLGKLIWKHPMMAAVPDSQIWMTVPYVVTTYLRHLVAPFYLSIIYGTSFVKSAADMEFVVPAALLAGLAFVLWVYRRRITSEMCVALALMVAPLLPVLNLKVFHHEYIVQDRYLYLPSIGFCYLVALLIVRVARRRAGAAFGLAAATLVVFGVSTVWQNRVWHDSFSLWQRAASYASDFWSVHYNLGLAHLQRKQYEQARAELLEAARRRRDVPVIYNNLALAQAGLGDTDGAINSLKEALRLDPRMVEANNNLGTILFDRQDYEGARRAFSQTLERDPSSVSARFNLARTFAATNDHAAAIREYETLLARQPDDAEARYYLALSYDAVGRKQEAAGQLERALSLEHNAERRSEMRRALERIKESR